MTLWYLQYPLIDNVMIISRFNWKRSIPVNWKAGKGKRLEYFAILSLTRAFEICITYLKFILVYYEQNTEY